MSNIPPSVAQASVDQKLAFAERYISVGWHVFIVRENKITLWNCPECKDAGADHSGLNCDHLICHGFYAATRDIERVRLMLEVYPQGLLALRTGQPSGVIAVDFESSRDDPNEPSGLEVRDEWASYTNGIELPQTLTSSSRSGGVHLLYKTDKKLASHNRILPSVDLKADGGYVVVPPGDGRNWDESYLTVTQLTEDLDVWLRSRSGGFKRRGGFGGAGGSHERGDGYNFAVFFQEGCPAGFRDDFINDLIFRLRKANTPWDRAEAIVREAHSRVAQPPQANYEMPWRHVAYKLKRMWRMVEPDPILDSVGGWLAQYQQEQKEMNERTSDDPQVKIVQQGRVTIARRTR